MAQFNTVDLNRSQKTVAELLILARKLGYKNDAVHWEELLRFQGWAIPEE